MSIGGNEAWQQPLAIDLDEVLDAAEADMAALDDARLFVTGGTGFVGTWLLEALVWVRRRRGVGPDLEVLTRDPEGFVVRSPHLVADGAVSLLRGDIRSPFMPSTVPDFIIHAATPASAALNESAPRLMYDTIVDGMHNVLDLAASASTPRVLFTSSGAVYGCQPPEVPWLTEDHEPEPQVLADLDSYHQGKRIAEHLCAKSAMAEATDVVIGRLFAFVGPYLPIDSHFAVGNFIRDALDGGPVVVDGDGTAFRSYQYAADLVVWLLALLVRGESGRAYNVGSDVAIDIASLARTVASEVGDVAVEVRGTPDSSQPAERYIPDCTRAQTELGLTNTVTLEEGIRRTAAWHRWRRR
jgi:dTDP-glucose 4,6-dehydratase